MQVSVMGGVFRAAGNAEEMAEYTVRVAMILKCVKDDEDRKGFQKEIDEVWKEIQKNAGKDGKQKEEG